MSDQNQAKDSAEIDAEEKKVKCDRCGDEDDPFCMRGDPEDGYRCMGCVADGDGYAEEAGDDD